MYLEYGVNDHGELVEINQVGRGKTELRCPYCGGLLLARKGEIMVHHFAHAGETCRQVERNSDTVALPAYDNFNLHLPGRAIEHLHNFSANLGGYDERYLEKFELVTFNEFKGRGDWELTKKGKLVLGDLSLMLFNDFQEPLILKRHEELHERARIAAATIESDLNTDLVDLRLYRAQWRRILTTNLYFLEVRHSNGVLHKIGVSTRNVEERVAEVKRDLSGVLDQVQIAVLDIWPHRGNVELYFKYRYKQFNHPLGLLTEYYKFDDIKAVLRDLRRMKGKELSDLEQQVMRGESSQIEKQIRFQQIEQRRRIAIKAGMQKAVKQGRHIGRPTETLDGFLSKPDVIKAKEAIEAGMSLRKVAALSGLAVNTVRKLKSIIEDKASNIVQIQRESELDVTALSYKRNAFT